eukprot:766788-Hanusia_phi.AAC.1
MLVQILVAARGGGGGGGGGRGREDIEELLSVLHHQDEAPARLAAWRAQGEKRRLLADLQPEDAAGLVIALEADGGELEGPEGGEHAFLLLLVRLGPAQEAQPLAALGLPGAVAREEGEAPVGPEDAASLVEPAQPRLGLLLPHLVLEAADNFVGEGEGGGELEGLLQEERNLREHIILCVGEERGEEGRREERRGEEGRGSEGNVLDLFFVGHAQEGFALHVTAFSRSGWSIAMRQ